MANIIFTVCALVFILLLLVVFYSKKRLEQEETSAFSKVLWSTLVGIIFVIFNYLLLKINASNTDLYVISTKLILIYYIFWNALFERYISVVSKCYKNKYLYLIVILFLVFVVIFLPISFENIDTMIVPKGYAVNFVYLIILGYIIVCTIKMLKNIKKVSIKKYYPLLAFIVIGFIAFLFQIANPNVLLTELLYSVIVYIIFFTIENPDIKMIEELSHLNALAQQSNVSKSQFVMDVTNDILDKLDKIDEIVDDISNDNPSDYTKERLYDLRQIASTARNKVKYTIDVSQMDSKLLKPINTKYSTSLLFDSIKSLSGSKTSPNVALRLSVESDIPDELYGDSFKVKQIIMSVLDNSFKNTIKGYVELRVHSIIKNNVCRLIITVEDTGCGMSLFEINDILNNHDELTDAEVSTKDDMILNLKIVKKMINLIGGALTIESAEKKGTNVTIFLDQKIVEVEKTTEEKKIDSFQKEFEHIKNIGIITMNKEVSASFNKILKKYDVHYEIYDETLKCLSKIREDYHYDLIIIEENMEKINARMFLQKVKDVRGYKTKMLVMCSSSDIRNKKELLDLGFNGIVSLPIVKKDIKEIVNKLYEK